MRTVVENRQDRRALAEDAGWGRISATSVAAVNLDALGPTPTETSANLSAAGRARSEEKSTAS